MTGPNQSGKSSKRNNNFKVAILGQALKWGQSGSLRLSFRTITCFLKDFFKKIPSNWFCVADLFPMWTKYMEGNTMTLTALKKHISAYSCWWMDYWGLYSKFFLKRLSWCICASKGKKIFKRTKTQKLLETWKSFLKLFLPVTGMRRIFILFKAI